jgi:formate hydrogenlyase subunit 3/multisubunit Na+/H+ antiporter MnhD subunit
MEINGIPAHPLVIHAAVVLVPLAALAVIAFVVPRWRAAARWPALVLTVVATVAVQLATLTGENLEETRGPDNALIRDHSEWGERLQILMYVLAVLVVVAFVVMPVVHRATGRDRPARVAVLEKPLMVLLPLLGVAAIVLVVITGDLGAQSVWGG